MSVTWAAHNVAVGDGFAIVTQTKGFPWFGLPPSDLALSGVFCAMSLNRFYTLSKLFERWTHL